MSKLDKTKWIEPIFISYFKGNPNKTYKDFAYLIKKQRNDLSLEDIDKAIDSVRKKLTTKGILHAVRKQDNKGLFYSEKTITI